jgi:hypothetical protein
MLGATAVGLLAVNSQPHPVLAQPAEGEALGYAALLTRDKALLDEAAGRTVRIGSESDLCYETCVSRFGQMEGAYQRLLGDLDQATPPARFAAEHARMRTDLEATIAILRWVIVNNTAGAATAASANNLVGNGPMVYGQQRDDLLTIEAYVVYEAGRVEPVRDAATAAYTAMVARDYDNLHLSTLFISLLTCWRPDPACAGPVATARGATKAFLADLRAGQPPAQFAATKPDLVDSLGNELMSLDEVDASYALPPVAGTSPQGEVLLFADAAVGQTAAHAFDTQSTISTRAARVLYTH